jgi:DNA-binding GntR family transcriptional regulator
LVLADEIATIGDDDGSHELLHRDVEVHREVYRAAGNPYLEDILVSLDAHATRIWCLFLDRLPGVCDHVREHAALLRAIVDGDEDKAAALTLAHVEGFEQAIRKLL